jgi:hypothetical protein
MYVISTLSCRCEPACIILCSVPWYCSVSYIGFKYLLYLK